VRSLRKYEEDMFTRGPCLMHLTILCAEPVAKHVKSFYCKSFFFVEMFNGVCQEQLDLNPYPANVDNRVS
jgi:hypothetical protein